jgi:hypothetical protein
MTYVCQKRGGFVCSEILVLLIGILGDVRRYFEQKELMNDIMEVQIPITLLSVKPTVTNSLNQRVASQRFTK